MKVLGFWQSQFEHRRGGVSYGFVALLEIGEDKSDDDDHNDDGDDDRISWMMIGFSWLYTISCATCASSAVFAVSIWPTVGM